MTQSISPTPENFQGLGIAENIMSSLERMKFTIPTPIQHQCIPIGIEGKDLIGIAQTGTGKTLAFGIPMIQRLARYKGLGLVLLPTRELAIQVDEAFNAIGGPIGLRTAILIGGEPMGKQRRMLARKPHILIATPGRLIDHTEQGLRLADVKILVLDEADRMLDMGFAPQINRILEQLPAERQTFLFSATMPADIVKIAARHMKMPVRIEVSPSGTTAEDVEQEIIIVPKENRRNMLETLLNQYSGTILIFSRTRHGAKKICAALREKGHAAAEIHSNRSQSQRKDALSGFKSGRYRILVATDIAARGIDVQDIEVVINYDLPDQTEDYVHRIGRTARAGKEGRAISFAAPHEMDDIRRIERLIRKSIKITHHQGGHAITKAQFAEMQRQAPAESKGKRPPYRPHSRPAGQKKPFWKSKRPSGGGQWNQKRSRGGGRNRFSRG